MSELRLHSYVVIFYQTDVQKRLILNNEMAVSNLRQLLLNRLIDELTLAAFRDSDLIFHYEPVDGAVGIKEIDFSCMSSEEDLLSTIKPIFYSELLIYTMPQMLTIKEVYNVTLVGVTPEPPTPEPPEPEPPEPEPPTPEPPEPEPPTPEPPEPEPPEPPTPEPEPTVTNVTDITITKDSIFYLMLNMNITSQQYILIASNLTKLNLNEAELITYNYKPGTLTLKFKAKTTISVIKDVTYQYFVDRYKIEAKLGFLKNLFIALDIRYIVGDPYFSSARFTPATDKKVLIVNPEQKFKMTLYFKRNLTDDEFNKVKSQFTLNAVKEQMKKQYPEIFNVVNVYNVVVYKDKVEVHMQTLPKQILVIDLDTGIGSIEAGSIVIMILVVVSLLIVRLIVHDLVSHTDFALIVEDVKDTFKYGAIIVVAIAVIVLLSYLFRR